MAQQENKPLTHEWSLLTAANATAVMLQNTGRKKVLLKAAASATLPTDDTGHRVMAPGEYRETTVAALFPGISGANRLFGRVRSGTGEMLVSIA